MGNEKSSMAKEPDRLCFLSLAPVGVDDIHYHYPNPPTDVPFRTLRCGIPGGAALWATFGARLFKPRECSEDVGCYLAVRGGFLEPALEQLRSWNMTTSGYRVKQSTNRVFLRYDDEEWTKYFKRQYKLLNPEIARLVDTEYLGAKCFHFLADAKRFTGTLYDLDGMRGLSEFHGERRLIIWEPPDNPPCVEVVDYNYALSRADVFSPSHKELLAITDDAGASAKFRYKSIEKGARKCIKRGIGPRRSGIIVVRCGQYGCFYMNGKNEKGWIRPYYSHRHPKVEDITGSGSAFLGAFGVAYMETGDMKMACVRGAVAASYALEQFGLPVLQNPDEPRGRFKIDELENEPIYIPSTGEIVDAPRSAIPNYGTFNNKPNNESSSAEASSSKRSPGGDKPITGSSSKKPENESSSAEASSSKRSPGGDEPITGSSSKMSENESSRAEANSAKANPASFRSKASDEVQIASPELWNGEDPFARLGLMESNPAIYADPRDDDDDSAEGYGRITFSDDDSDPEEETASSQWVERRDFVADAVTYVAPLDNIDESDEENGQGREGRRRKKGKAPLISTNF
ncbi:Ribokinase-like protein [Xylaria bambusicola]|uniref:Ribokinase-like protein n=1 Tax=Xylaria bambusicola TaxID=326684 RepID=UPI002008186E|nr:Ribokinase-like protein [Xylaria bambusicola]KAI0516902.1 Ribokinase-like protein [Xylaria bambusicola]